jgi:predicted enzyme related to lactoylglutathione lyase
MSNAEVLGRFVWHELMTPDPAGAAAFYPKVLPWRTAPSSLPGYTIFMAGQTQIGGLMASPGDASAATAHWLIYVGTPNVDSTCTQAQGLGAHLVKAPADIPNVGRFAVLADPQGATFAVFTPGAGPAPADPPQGGFTWHELQTTDIAAALRFYGALFGWKAGRAHDMGAMGVYQIITHGGKDVGGLARPAAPSAAPSWLSYVHVADATRAVAAAKGAGGRLLHGPMEVPGGSWIALMMDPQAGAFAVQEAPRTTTQPKPAAAPAAAPKAAKPASAAAAPAAKPAAAKPAAAKPAKKKAARKAVKKAAKKAKKAKKKKAVRRPAKKAAKRKPARKSARRPAKRARRR